MMENENLSIEDITKAYELLKRYIYVNKDKLFSYERIVEFESREGDINEKLDLIHLHLQNIFEVPMAQIKDFIENDDYWKPLFEEIDAQIFLKRKKSDNDKSQVFNNYKNPEISEDDKLIYFIDLPIELHLIAMVWCLKVGLLLVKDMGEANDSLFANQIKWKKKDELTVGFNLYEAFYHGYNRWVRSAINNIQNLLNEGKKALFISIDLKDYFYSVSIDYKKLYRPSKLNVLLEQITSRFFYKLVNKYEVKISGYNQETNHYPLPIGLCSSNILANWVFKNYDEAIKNKLRPCFYGRYVDDILLVLCNPKDNLDTQNKIIDSYMKELFVDNTNSNERLFKPIQKDLSKFIVKNEKISVATFDPNYCTLSLQRLEEQIKENSSEFEFLPDEEILDSNFGKVIDIVQVTDDLQRLSEVTINKTKLSFFLAKLSSILTLTPNKDPKIKTWIKSLIQCMNGLNALEFYSQWDKLLSTCLLYGDKELLLLALKNIDNTITNLKVNSKNSNKILCIKKSYSDHFLRSVALILALKPTFLDNTDRYKHLATEELKKTIVKIRKGLMFRWSYLQYPLLPLTSLASENELVPISNINDFLQDLIKPVTEALKLIDQSNIVIPVFISLHDFILFLQVKKILSNDMELTLQSDASLQNCFLLFHSQEIFDIAEGFNSKPKNPERRKAFLSGSGKSKFKIAIVNINFTANLTRERLESPTLSLQDIDDFSFILNQAKREKTDMICFPEISVDRQLLSWLCLFSRKNQMVIVAGVKHWISNNYAYNFLLTILPFEHNNKRDSMPIFRLKNYYAPEEQYQLEGFGYKIPHNTNIIKYDLFIWNDLYFTCFNCYELADIKSRMMFRSEVDLIVASEYNKDTNYFSNIVESSTRDLHCFFTQANNARYGDSRVTKPAKTELKDITKIKGGINTTLLVSEIDINALRNFQSKEYSLQKDDKSFKPTPPCFNTEKVRKRNERRIYLGYERKAFEIK